MYKTSKRALLLACILALIGLSISCAVDQEGQQARREPMNLSKDRPQWRDDGTIAANEKVSENPSLGVANPVERNRRKPQKQTDPNSDVRLDRSEKLKGADE